MYNKAQRNPALEALRILAAFGVVAYHAKVPYMDIPYAGLVVFVILSPYVDLNYLSNNQRPIKNILKTFLIPWLFWMVVYGIVNILAKKQITLTEGDEFSKILSGTSMHLWFMPFMCAFLIVLNLIKPTININFLYYISLVIIYIIFLNNELWFNLIKSTKPPYAQWIHATPALFVGVALGISNRVRCGKVIFIITMTILICHTIIIKGLPGINPTYPVGIFLFTSISLIKNNSKKYFPTLQSLANCSLGIYMVHMIWVGIYNNVIGRESWLSAIFAFFSSLLIVWYVRRIFPITKHVLG